MRRRLDPRKYALKVVCTKCGHTQVVEPASVHMQEVVVGKGKHLAVEERPAMYFGARYSHCDKCDGPTKEIDTPS